MTFRVSSTRHRAMLVMAALLAAVLASGCNEAQVASKPRPVQARLSAAVPIPPAPVGTTTIATVRSTAPGSPEPGLAPTTEVPASWYGYPSVLPVVGTAPDWIEVRLAQRPDGSTTWIPSSDVSLSSTPYQLVLSLSTEHLAVFEYGKEILDFPAGVGTPDDPTVTGNYFIAMRVPPPGPGYGPFVLVTSAHSDAISDWDDSGDAIIAIHGPITSYDDQLIGSTGAAISHGCIRLHDADLTQLDDIPAGTPLEITSGTA